jgi:hypothetical protein
VSSHAPVLVRARLAAGIAQAAPWGIALDSLLAAQLWSREKQRLHDAGHTTEGLHDTDVPADLPLPLARCTMAAGDDPQLWHWAATTAWPEGRPADLPPDVHTWTGRLDHRTAEQLTPDLPNVVSDRQGRYRARRMPLLVTVCQSVTWTAVGDVEAITDLLAPIRAIGKKRSSGEGHVIAWEITPLPGHDPWAAAHQHPNGSLGRPTPTACLSRTTPINDGGRGTAGIRPPYMHRHRQHDLHLPVSIDS